jgi:hypothetical protein
MFSFHTVVHACSAEVGEGPEIELRGKHFRTLAVNPAVLVAPMPVSFEQAGEALTQLERLFFEPDGSFVWVSSQNEQPWQVDSNVFDRNGHVLFVDLKGACPEQQFDQLLSAFGWPTTTLMFQLVREAVFLAEADFRRYAQLSRSATARS